mgnify:CR=1 FL=1
MHKKKILPKHIREFISDQIGTEIRAGYPTKQAVAMSYSMARREFPEYAELLKR